MSTLNLGVIDIAYAYEQQRLSKKGKPLKRGRKVTKSITTGEVADYLEEEYHIMETFFELHSDQIMQLIADAYIGALETFEISGMSQDEPSREAMEAIEQMFRDFLGNEELNNVMPGVPTIASGQTAERTGGIQHRFAHPYAKANPSRPSFIDTGLFQSSFRAWFER